MTDSRMFVVLIFKYFIFFNVGAYLETSPQLQITLHLRCAPFSPFALQDIWLIDLDDSALLLHAFHLVFASPLAKRHKCRERYAP